MTWYIRIAFIVLLGCVAGWGFMEHRAKEKAETQRDTAIATANHNYAQFHLIKQKLGESEAANHQLVEQHNAEVKNLFMLAEKTAKDNEAFASRMLAQSAVWQDRNAHREGVKRSQVCEERLNNIGTFLDNYFMEVRDVAAR